MSEKLEPTLSGEGSSYIFSAVAPQDLELDRFAHLEEGIFMIEIDSHVPSYFP